MAETDILAQILSGGKNMYDPTSYINRNPYYKAGGNLSELAMGNAFPNSWQGAIARVLTGLGGGALSGYGQSAGQQQWQEALPQMIRMEEAKFKREDARKLALVEQEAKVRQKYDLPQGMTLDAQGKAVSVPGVAETQLAQKQTEFRGMTPLEVERTKLQEQAKKAQENGIDLKFIREEEDKARERIEKSQAGKDFADVEKAYGTINALAKRDDRASHITLIASFARLNDPASTVREGEVKLSQAASPWLEGMIKKLESEVAGTGFLSQDTRNQILEVSKIKRDQFAAPVLDVSKLAIQTAKARTKDLADDSRMLPYSLPQVNAGGGSSAPPPPPGFK